MVTGFFMIDFCLILELIKHEAEEKKDFGVTILPLNATDKPRG
jgi:hypothetical protein